MVYVSLVLHFTPHARITLAPVSVYRTRSDGSVCSVLHTPLSGAYASAVDFVL